MTVGVLILCALPILFVGTTPVISLPEMPWHQWFNIPELARRQYGSLGGPFTHTIILLLGGTIAFCGAILSIARSTVRQSMLTSVVSIGLFWVAVIYISQVVTAESEFTLDQDLEFYITFTGFVTRAVVALLLTLGGALLLVPGSGRFLNHPRMLIRLFLFFGALSIAVIWLANNLELPQTIFADQIIKRPYDIPTLSLLVLCNTALFPKLHAQYQSYFSFAVWLSTIALIAAQLYLIFGSRLIFDDIYNVSFAMQVLAFSILFGGLVWDYARSTGEEMHLLDVVQSREARLQRMFDSSSDAIIAVGEQGRIEMWNQTATEIFGHEPGEAVGKNILELLIPPDLQQQYQAYVEQSLLAEKLAGDDFSEMKSLELAMNHREGTTVDVIAEIDSIQGDDAWAYTLVAKDLTERKRLERRLIQMDRMITIGTLAAGVGHEIKNPLTFLMSHLELAQESLADEEVDLSVLRQDLEAAQVGAQRIYRIMKDLKMMSGFQKEPLQRIYLHDAIKVALRMTKHQIQGRAVLKEELPTGICALADEGRLSQVIINLLLNASHAMPARPRDENEINIRLAADEEQAIIEIRDNGIGIPEHLQAQVFEPFFTTKARGEGTGLGLSLSRQIIESFHGELTLESKVGEGTVFRISLPRLD